MLRGRPITTTDPACPRGVAQGVDADGALLLQAEGQSHRIVSGETTLLGPPEPAAAMLRWLASLLLFANLAFWTLTQEPVAVAIGLNGDDGRDPARLARQVHPEKVKVLRGGLPASAPSASADADPLACLETGPLDAAQAQATTAALQRAGVPSGAWVEMRRELPG
eukprot:gene14049-18960_t